MSKRLRVCNASVCVLREGVRSAARVKTLRGGSRRPRRPFQVLCVLVAVALAAAFSPSSAVAGPSRQPALDKLYLGRLGERFDANKFAVISGNPDAFYLSVAYDLSDVHGRRS